MGFPAERMVDLQEMDNGYSHIDGYHIRTGICAFFIKFLPDIIKAGKLYIAEPPLYKLTKGKDVYYVASQTEYLQKCIDSIEDMEISFPDMK